MEDKIIKKKNKELNMESVDENTQIIQNKEKGFIEKMSLFKKIVIILVIGISINYAFQKVTKKLDPNLVHFINDLHENQTFNLNFFLHDLFAKDQTKVYSKQQIPYKNDILNSFNFTLNIDKKKIEVDPNRYRLETQLIYNSNKYGHAKSITIYMHLSENLQTKIKISEYYDPITKDKQGIIQPHIFTKIFPQLVFDNNKYDFTENEIINYMYQTKPVKIDQNNIKEDYFYPHLDNTNYWLLRRDKIPLSNFNANDTIPIEVYFLIPSINKQEWVFKLLLAENQANSVFNDSQAMEEFKVILSDNSFGYLTLLFSINFLHSLFSLLSIKNNISFYKGLKSKQGISMRKHYTDIFFQGIIILYLIENDTSIMVIIMTVLESLISIWIAIKMTKFEKRMDGCFPYYQLVKGTNPEELVTEKYDQEATSFLSKLFFPILGIYYFYSFIIAKEINYYSFILKNLVTFIHAVGFINMTPQIYINYKLKSVEFMPWKGMIYQFLNTIIDDLFAFAVKMPTLQRISVFRDDVIFIIYLSQKWIYRKNIRQNEEKDKTD